MNGILKSIGGSTGLIGLFVLAAFAMNVHAGDLSGSSYSADHARAAQAVVIGTVEDVRRVEIEASPTARAAGASIGGLGASVIANSASQRSGLNGGSMLAAVGGALLGDYVARKVATREAVEIIVSFSNGQAVAVTQEIDSEAASLNPGDRVRLLTYGQTVRVAKLRNQAAPVVAQVN